MTDREKIIERVELELKERCFCGHNSDYSSYGVANVIVDLVISALEEKPFEEKYGIEINGMWTPLSKLPHDINELNKLVKPEEKQEVLYYKCVCGLVTGKKHLFDIHECKNHKPLPKQIKKLEHETRWDMDKLVIAKINELVDGYKELKDRLNLERE